MNFLRNQERMTKKTTLALSSHLKLDGRMNGCIHWIYSITIEDISFQREIILILLLSFEWLFRNFYYRSIAM
jgi:hypothetical protein